MDDRTSDRKSMADRLVAALQQDEFVLYAQPIVPLSAQANQWPFQEIYVRFTEEDAKLLHSMGVDYFQGFFFGKPEIEPEWLLK